MAAVCGSAAHSPKARLAVIYFLLFFLSLYLFYANQHFVVIAVSSASHIRFFFSYQISLVKLQLMNLHTVPRGFQTLFQKEIQRSHPSNNRNHRLGVTATHHLCLNACLMLSLKKPNPVHYWYRYPYCMHASSLNPPSHVADILSFAVSTLKSQPLRSKVD